MDTTSARKVEWTVSVLVASLLGVATSATSNTLGNVSFPVTCAPAVQDDFDRGVALLHHMMYVEARKTFENVVVAEPKCAMAHWGVAMTLFQPLWPTRPGPEELRRGWQAVKTAKALRPASERERAYVGALESFYQSPESSDYWVRLKRFEESMARVFRSHPDDREAAAFYALSLLATAPQAAEPLTHNVQAARILLEIYRDEPTHPGAVHYTIHANDVDGREGESLDVVRSYSRIAPNVPHALHMPTHIFVRLGDWEEVIAWNRRSADAALEFPAGESISHHYPHAVDYLVYAHLQRAEDDRAQELIDLVHASTDYQKSFMSAYHLAALPARFFLERRQWTEAATVAVRTPPSIPWQRFPWPEALTQFARGLGAARAGDLHDATTAVKRLGVLAQTAEAAGEEYFVQQIEVSRLAVAAWLAYAQRDNDAALRLMQASADLEASTEKHPVTPGALLPAYELLGDLLVELGRADEAIEAYETSMKTWPGRFNTLAGAARASVAAGHPSKALSYYETLVALSADPNSNRPALVEARAFLGEAEQTEP